MENRDKIRFKHMLDSATAILHFIEGKNRRHFASDRMFSSAIVREVEILEEAANHTYQRAMSRQKTCF